MTAIASQFSQFLTSLRVEGSRTALSAERLAEVLELPLQSVASLAHVHRNTVSMAPNSPKLQDAIRSVVRVLSAAYELTGDVDQALFWFCNEPIADFDHLTAMQLVEKGKVQAVIDYLESIGVGASG